MEFRRLGETELQLSVLGMGCNRIANAASVSEAREIEMTIREAVEHGINLFDTADVYGDGHSERILGRVLGNRRSEIHLCTKAGGFMGAARRTAGRILPLAARRLVFSLKPSRGWPKAEKLTLLNKNFKMSHIESAIKGSLRRLKTDYLDLFLLHSPPYGQVLQSGMWEMLARLKEKGTIRYYGVSLSNLSTSEEAVVFLDIEGLSVIQILTNPISRLDVQRVIPQARKKGVGVISREPFAKGKIFSKSVLLRAAAGTQRYSLAQMAVRAAVQIDGVASVITGMQSRDHLRENVSALDGPPLSSAQIASIYGQARLF